MSDPSQTPPVPPYAQPVQPAGVPPQPYGQPAQPYGQQPYGYAPAPPVNPYAAPGFAGAWPYPTNPADAPTPGAGFAQAISLFFRKYAQFTGRASRSEYWWVTLFLALVALVVYVPAVLLVVFGGIANENGGAGGGLMMALGIILFVLLGLFVLATLIPGISVTVRRLHDANFSGLFYLLTLAGLSIVVLVMNVLESNPAGQRYDRPA